jgi:lipoate-protein ligase A
MAIDELLLRDLGNQPVLRVYDWDGAWVSVGYFGDLEAARAEFGPGVSLVRRWTGGGVVDHREDFTYSLVIPPVHPLSKAGRREVYRAVHEGVAAALQACGVKARLVAQDMPGESVHCFEKPVAWDVVAEDGRKLAGAGQRRTRDGFLHQGSVLAPGMTGKRAALTEALVSSLAGTPTDWEPGGSLLAQAKELAAEKY